MDNEYFETYGYPLFYNDIQEYWKDWKMANRIEFLNDLELEEHLKDMSDREVIEFVARQTYDVCNLAGSNERRIILLEKRGNRFIGIVGAFGAFIGAIVIAVVNYFAGR